MADVERAEQHLVLLVEGDEILEAGKPVLFVRHFSIHEELHGLFEVELIAVSKRHDLDLGKIVGRAAAFQIRAGESWSPATTRLYNGLCVQAEQLESSRPARSSAGDGFTMSTYLVRIAPSLWRLTERRNHRIFQHAAPTEVVKTLLAEWSIVPEVELTAEYKKREMLVQWGESDHAFASRLLAQAGACFHFRFPAQAGPPPADGVARPVEASPTDLVLADALTDAKRSAKNLRFVERIRYEERPSRAVAREYVTRVVVRHEVRPGRVAVRDFDFRKKLDFMLFASEAIDKRDPRNPEAFYEQYRWAPGAMRVEGDPGAKKKTADAPVAYTHDKEGEGAALAGRSLEALRAGRRVVRFETNCIDLAPGTLFRIADHPREDVADALLLVTRFSGRGTLGDEWSFEAEAAFADEPWRPPLRTPKPRIFGFQSAMVVGPAGKDLWVDELGRVKVKFHWDREGGYDDTRSAWLRVAQGWAGPGFGLTLLPRVGHEVFVSFLDGDPDEPVVVGRLHNVTAPPPYPLPDRKTRTTWKTNSLGKAGQEFNELMLEDEKEKEVVYLQAQRDWRKGVRKFETARVGQNAMSVVGGKRTAVVGKLDAVMVGERYLLRVVKPPSASDLKILEQEQPGVSPTGTIVEIKDERILLTTGKATVAFDKRHVRIDASGSITIQADGGDCIIEGSHVYLNTGTPAPAPKPDDWSLPTYGSLQARELEARKKLEAEAEEVQKRAALAELVPKPPEQVICDLVQSKLQCQHGRGPCLDPKDELYRVLQVAPEWPKDEWEEIKPAAGGKPGGAKREKLKRAPKGLAWVAEGGDAITLAASLSGGCGKHPTWRYHAPKRGEATVYLYSHVVEKAQADFDTGAWLERPWLARLKLNTDEIVEAIDKLRVQGEFGGDYSKASRDNFFYTDAEVPQTLDKVAEKLGLPRGSLRWLNAVHGKVEGLSWTAGALPKRLFAQPAACRSVGEHHYAVHVYPSDTIKVGVALDLTKIPLGAIGLGFLSDPIRDFDDWADNAGRQVAWEKGKGPTQLGQKDKPVKGIHKSIGRFKLDFDAMIQLEAGAAWKEWSDHRAYYHYEASVGIELELKVIVEVPLESYVGLIPGVGTAAAAVVAAGNFVGRIISIPAKALGLIEDEIALLKITGKLEASGKTEAKLTFERKSPDTRRPKVGGEAALAITAKLSLSAFTIHKAVLSGKAQAETKATFTAKPHAPYGIADPTIELGYAWTPLEVSVEARVAGRGWRIKKKLFKDQTGDTVVRPLHFLQRSMHDVAL
jgi:type VI secretion system secreted protein VgrG